MTKSNSLPSSTILRTVLASDASSILHPSASKYFQTRWRIEGSPSITSPLNPESTTMGVDNAFEMARPNPSLFSFGVVHAESFRANKKAPIVQYFF
jgi:hypothetical protein